MRRFFLNLIDNILREFRCMIILLHHLAIHSPIPLFNPLGLPQIAAIDIRILEVEFAGMFAEIRKVVAEQVCSLEVHAALLPLLLFPLMQLHLEHHVVVLSQHVAQRVLIIELLIVIIFICAGQTS
jgi:hypothetical protein